MKKRYIVKIPKDIIVIYNSKKNIIVLKGPLLTKSLTIKVKITLVNFNKFIEISATPLNICSYLEKKSGKSFQGITVALIKTILIETSSVLNFRLKLIGISYRVFEKEHQNKLLFFKLGFSHFLYFKTPKNLKIYCLKFTKLFIYGNSYNFITQTMASIRELKKPEPYKGKGILYDTEKIVLKKGKKI